MKKNVPVLGIAVGLFIFIRCIFDNNVNLKYIVGTLNIIAVVFVVYTILERVVANVVAKIEESQAPIQIRIREKKQAPFKIWGWGIGIGLILIIVYLIWWCSNLGNDIVSIIALGLSVLDEEVVQIVSNIYRI